MRLRVCKQVLLELVLAVKSLTAQRTAVRSPVNHAMLDQVGTRREPLITQMTGVRPVTEVQVLVFHEDVLVAEASVTYRALVGLLPDVCQSNMADQSVLVAELFATERTLERAVVCGRRLGQ